MKVNALTKGNETTESCPKNAIVLDTKINRLIFHVEHSHLISGVNKQQHKFSKRTKLVSDQNGWQQILTLRKG